MTDRPIAGIQTVVLDMAGTTVVDDGLVERAFAEAWTAFAAEPPSADAVAHVQRTMGQSKIEVFRVLLPEAAAQALNVEFEAALDRIVREGGVSEIEGAADAIRALRAQGRSVVLTTGFARSTADAIIAALDWRPLVDDVLTPADAGRGRPAPDLNLLALMRTGAEAVSNLAVIGDTPSDARSGRRAGAGLVVAVRTGGRDSDDALRAAGADEIVDSVAEVPALIARLGG